MPASKEVRTAGTPQTVDLARAESRGDETYMFGRGVYLPGGWVGPLRQRAYFLITLLEGRVEIDFDGELIDVRSGQGILLPPGGIKLYRFDGSVRSVHNWCQIAPNIPDSRERSLLRKAAVVSPFTAGVNLLIEEGLSTPMNAGPELHHAMRMLAKACLLRFAAQTVEGMEARKILHPSVSRAVQTIAGSPSGFRSAEELAAHCGISYSRLRKLYREAMGESPSRAIWRFKTEHAVQLLRATGLTLAEIAEQCGFSNAFHLSRCIKKQTGFTPRELRGMERARAV